MIPDKFDPLMDLSRAKNVGDPNALPSPSGESERIPADVQKYDTPAVANNIVIPGSEKPLSTADGSGYGGPPADVDRFSGGV